MKQFLDRVWFGWLRDSETMALGWLQAIAGVAGTLWQLALALFAAMDWTTLITGFQFGLTRGQVIVLFLVLFAQGALTVLARRRRDPEMH